MMNPTEPTRLDTPAISESEGAVRFDGFALSAGPRGPQATTGWKELYAATGLSPVSAKRCLLFLARCGLVTIEQMDEASVTLAVRMKGGHQ